MAAVLGIDAAWTEKEPSGVALVATSSGRWELITAAPSYDCFCGGPPAEDGRPRRRHRGSMPDAAKLLAASAVHGAAAIDLVAVDMPLARLPIVTRRPCDNAVSSTYGARKCGTHSPTPLRPGLISAALTASFEKAGMPLHTAEITGPGVIEVYPHPALVELMQAPVRVTYKIGKIGNYWPATSRDERRAKLLAIWSTIVTALDAEIAGVAGALPLPHATATTWELKAYEDALDAVICAWVGVCALEGRCRVFGGSEAAIRVPLPRSAM